MALFNFVVGSPPLLAALSIDWRMIGQKFWALLAAAEQSFFLRLIIRSKNQKSRKGRIGETPAPHATLAKVRTSILSNTVGCNVVVIMLLLYSIYTLSSVKLSEAYYFREHFDVNLRIPGHAAPC